MQHQGTQRLRGRFWAEPTTGALCLIQGAFVLNDRILGLSQLLQHFRPRKAREEKPRLQVHRLRVRGCRPSKIAHGLIDPPEMVLSRSIRRRRDCRPLQQIQRARRPPRPQRAQSYHVERLGMVGRLGEHSLVSEFGGREVAAFQQSSRIGWVAHSAVSYTHLVFGLTGIREGLPAHATGVNLTVILQGTNRIFGTLGDSRCTIDSLSQKPLPSPGSYRVEARGFCTQPAHAVRGDGDLLVSTFEFAGPVSYTTDAAAVSAPAK